MSSVGPHLRELRDRRGVSLEEIARVTRVGRSYLEAIETGRFETLPAPVFTRGFIRAYCQALGESADEALARYDNRGGEARTDSAPVRTPAPGHSPLEPRGRGPVLVSFVLLVVLGVALFAVTLALQAGRDLKPDRRAEPARSELPPAERLTSTAPGNPADAASTPQPVASPPAAGLPPVSPPPAGDGRAVATATPSAVAPPTALPERPAAAPPVAAGTAPGNQRAAMRATAPYRLIARTTQSTWIRVRTEDGHSSEETIPAGQMREWISNRRFTIAIGNAGGVTIELNGVALPSLGGSGVVIPRLVLPSDEP